MSLTKQIYSSRNELTKGYIDGFKARTLVYMAEKNMISDLFDRDRDYSQHMLERSRGITDNAKKKNWFYNTGFDMGLEEAKRRYEAKQELRHIKNQNVTEIGYY